MKFSQLQEYVTTLQKLKVEYGDRLDIKIGLEIEYIPKFQDYYQELVDSGSFDMLLLGQHVAMLPNGKFTYE